MGAMISSLEQARRRRRLNQQIRELIAIRRAIGRLAPDDPDVATQATGDAAA